MLELNEDPEVARAKYFIRDEFLVNIADKIFTVFKNENEFKTFW